MASGAPPFICIIIKRSAGSRGAPNLGCSCLPPAGRCRAGELETSDPVTVVLGQDAKLPCFYRGEPGEQVGQVAWARVDAAEGARELALLHSKYGLHVSAAYEGRVEQPPPPRSALDGAVLLRHAVQADEGEYECRVSTFPAGSFQARLRLRVLGEWGAGRMRGAGGCRDAWGRGTVGTRGGVLPPTLEILSQRPQQLATYSCRLGKSLYNRTLFLLLTRTPLLGHCRSPKQDGTGPFSLLH